MFWSMIGSVALLLVTGIVIWRAYFAEFFPITIIRSAMVLHMLAAFIGIISLITHVYAAIWIKGTVRAMTRGTVDADWAKQHHPEWHRKMTKEKIVESSH